MKIRPANLFWIIVLAVVVGGIIYVLIPSRPDIHGQQIVADARQLLRQEGFKTDLADFDFSTPPEIRVRENILKATVLSRNSGPLNDPNLMEIIGTNLAIVVWKQDSLKKMNPSWSGDRDELTWDDFRKALDVNHTQVDAACDAVFSGPIAFNVDASRGSAMLLPHLAVLKNLAQTLGSRMVLALHDGDKNTAWTNLLAATRLVTAWKVEPAEISHLVQFATTKIIFDATWQALQTNNWPDEQLARLQTEWEAVNFFTNLPETAAFKRASDVAACEFDRHEILESRPPVSEFLHEVWPNPLNFWGDERYRWNQREYLGGGKYEVEKDLLYFYRDREIEFQNAIQSPTWTQMRQLPGVTNEIFYQPKYRSPALELINMHRATIKFQQQGSSFLGRAAEAEAERRILIAAIALERHRARHGSYPQTLGELAPEFLKTVPTDFMDGQPLRYRLTQDGHFILYSVGLDCVDNGGKIQPRSGDQKFVRPLHPGMPLPESDIVWPLPASSAQAAAQLETEQKAQQEWMAQDEQRGKAQEAQDETMRQAAVKKLLAMKPPFIKTDPIFRGEALNRFLQNKRTSGTNRLSLDELLSLKQIITGQEPDIATFEVQVSHDVMTNMVELQLLVDDGAGGNLQGCNRATNGDCLLVWNTTYDPPGQHALQARLLCAEIKHPWHNFELKGPVTSFYSSNVVQFFEGNSFFTDKGTTLYAKLPEPNGVYTIEIKTPEGKHLKTISGTTSNGVINVDWNLKDDQGKKYNGNSLQAIYNVTLPDSKRSQILRGP